jgi:type VI secretion system protein VasG
MLQNWKFFFGKVNETTRDALEAGVGLCASRTHYEVEIEHYLMKLLDETDSDLQHILKHFGVDNSRLAAELTRSLDRMKTGNGRGPMLSQMLVRMLTEAWLLGSVDYGAGQIRSGFTVLALYSNDELTRVVREVSKELQKIQPDALRKDLLAIVGGSHEEAITAAADEPGAAAPGDRPRAAGGKTPNLDQYTINLSERAKSGKIDPVLGRDPEIRQVVDILTRRRQNNPILTGEAGVGKTAVVEGFALRIADGDVPPVLKNVTLRTLDLALLQAGAGVKGEFENRLKGLIEEVKASPTRRVAHHRRHHVVRVQKVLRKRRSARAAVPSCQSRGTDRGAVQLDAAWAGPGSRAASQCPHSRRGPGVCGPAIPSLPG